MSNRQSPENIQSQIDYIKTKKIKEAQDTIDYYKEVGANADLTRYEDEIVEFEQDIINLETVLKDGPKKLDTIKVKIVEYKGSAIVEVIDPEDFDPDYLGAGQGRYACMLMDNSRLAISNEALAIIKGMGRTRDVLGCFVGDESHFAWCGGPNSVFNSEDKVCRDFKIPVGFQTIDNEVGQEVKDFIDGKEEGAENIDYSEIKHELWIDLTRSGNHTDDKGQNYVYENFFKLSVRPLEKYIHDQEVNILNAPVGRVIDSRSYEDSRQILMSDENLEQIKKLSEGIFVVNNKVEDVEFNGDIKDLWKKLHREGSVHEDDIMSYINGFYELGFFNNCMNPHKHYWRMSIVDTPENIIETLKKFKKA